MKKTITTFILLFLLTSCGNKERLKITDRGNIDVSKDSGGLVVDSEVFFADVLAEVFDKNSTCTECHNGFIEPADYSTYADVKRDINKILKEVLSNSMPQFGPPLSDEQKVLLQDWVALGAVESKQEEIK